LIEGLEGTDKDSFMLHYNFPPYSVGEAGFMGGPKRREVGHGRLAKRGVMAVMPKEEDFPYSIRVVSEITESNGSSSMASVCGSSLALMDAGVPVSAPVAGIAMGLIKEEDRFAVLTDILGDEDHLGDMDFKVAGTETGVTALQMDIKIQGITEEIMEIALAQANEARKHILGEMNKVISKARDTVSENAPAMAMLKIDPDKIRDVIGKGGAVIRGITDETGASIDIDDDGNVRIYGEDATSRDAAVEMVNAITAEAEVGRLYTGKVARIVDFGAFVTILPGKDGLVHISQIAKERVEDVGEYLKEGQEVLVKVTDLDARGRIKLSMKEITDEEVQGFTNRQGAATRYAARQVTAYLSDALFDGKGLPERSTGSGNPEDARRIFASDGMWTSRLRREWSLFFDRHGARGHGLDSDEERERKEKNRGDHHHHAIDAVVIALGSRDVQWKREQREKEGDAAYWEHVKVIGSSASYEDWMENYRRQQRLRPPAPYEYPGLSVDEAIEKFRTKVEAAVFGEDGAKPICHRPVKRKLIGALHEETLLGPVLDAAGSLSGNYTARKSVLALTPNHLRMPRPETEKEAIARLAARRMREKDKDERAARKWARGIVRSDAYTPAIVDPPPEKSGLVRDRGLRARLRECLEENGLDPDRFTVNEIKKLAEAGKITHVSGVPIESVVLLRTISDPVLIDRRRPEYGTGRVVRDADPSSKRAYVGGNNHHVEIRVSENGTWSGEIVTAYQAAQRKLAKLRAFRAAGVPKPQYFRDLKRQDRSRWNAERERWRPVIRKIEAEHPLVDRSDNDDGSFVMSLCEGETVWMRHKRTGEVGYFVVAKLDKPRSIVLVPHWDARAAGERKDANGNKIAGSKRDQFAATPADLGKLAPPGEPHARKVHVTPLGEVTVLDRD